MSRNVRLLKETSTAQQSRRIFYSKACKRNEEMRCGTHSTRSGLNSIGMGRNDRGSMPSLSKLG